jgi:hypothetical protein
VLRLASQGLASPKHEGGKDRMKDPNCNVRNAPVQPLHYNSVQSQSHYRLLGFTNVSVPSQSPADTCPMFGWLVVGLCRSMTSDNDEPSAALARPSLRRHLRPIRTSGFGQTSITLQRKSEATQVKVKGEAPSCEASFIGEILRDPHPASPTIAPHR